MKLKWGYSKTKEVIFDLKLIVILDKEILCLISMLIHSGSPHDSKIFDETLNELKQRKLFIKRTIILFNRGYYSLDNYKIGINRYKFVPIIFQKYEKIEQKLSDNLAYPLEIYNKKHTETIKQEYKQLKKILIQKISNWKELKLISGLIEDFFKVAKDTFGLGTFHKCTTQSINKSIYLCILLNNNLHTTRIQHKFVISCKLRKKLNEVKFMSNPLLFNQILFVILLFEMAFSIYSVSKFVGEEMNGPQKVANKDRDGNFYGGYHYEHGINTTVGALMIFGFLIEFMVLLGIPIYLEKWMPFQIVMIIEIIIFGGIQYWLIKDARPYAEKNEIKCRELNQKIGYYDD